MAVRGDSLGTGDPALAPGCANCDWSSAAMASDATSLAMDADFAEMSDAV